MNKNPLRGLSNRKFRSAKIFFVSLSVLMSLPTLMLIVLAIEQGEFTDGGAGIWAYITIPIMLFFIVITILFFRMLRKNADAIWQSLRFQEKNNLEDFLLSPAGKKVKWLILQEEYCIVLNNVIRDNLFRGGGMRKIKHVEIAWIYQWSSVEPLLMPGAIMGENPMGSTINMPIGGIIIWNMNGKKYQVMEVDAKEYEYIKAKAPNAVHEYDGEKYKMAKMDFQHFLDNYGRFSEKTQWDR